MKLTLLFHLNGNWTPQLIQSLSQRLLPEPIVYSDEGEPYAIVLEGEWRRERVAQVVPGVAFEHRLLERADDPQIPFRIAICPGA